MPFPVPAWLTSGMIKLAAVIAGLLFISFLWWRGDHYQERAAKSDALLGTVTDIANNNAKISELRDKKIQKIQVVLVTGQKKQTDLDKKYADDVRRIENAASSDECPVGASVREWLNGLPEPENPTPDPIRPGPRGSHARYVAPAYAKTR